MNKYYYIIILLFCGFLLTCKENEMRSMEKDKQELQSFFNQIKTISEQVPCENVADWKFVAYGAMACGGPVGFIPYSTKIDTANFLKLITEYESKERAFNIKWSVTSTCIAVLPPKGISCENGKPKLVN